LDGNQSIFLLDIEDLHMEAILGGGFWGNYQFASEIHSHTYFELMMCYSGSFSLTLNDGSALTLDADCLCLIPPGVYHCSRDISPDARKSAIRFYCTRNLTPGSIYSTFTGITQRRTAPVLLGKQPQLMALTALLSQELQKVELARDTCVKAILSQFFVILLRLLCKDMPIEAPAGAPGTDPAARRLTIEEFFHSRHSEPITEEDLASLLHISKRQLSRVLRQLFGSSFRRLLIDVRLSHAVQLLTTTDLSAEEVAGLVGYGSVSGFYDAFRKRYGVAAGSYKHQRFR
jgi:AraC-like DNA-binding protein